MTTTDDLAWNATFALIKTARRFRNAFWWFLALGIVALIIATVLTVQGGAYINFNNLAAGVVRTVVAQALILTAGSLLLGWLITGLLARHAQVIYFSGPNSSVRNLKDDNAPKTSGSLQLSNEEEDEVKERAYVRMSRRKCPQCDGKDAYAVDISGNGLWVDVCSNCSPPESS